jgi:hypothetical protein
VSSAVAWEWVWPFCLRVRGGRGWGGAGDDAAATSWFEQREGSGESFVGVTSTGPRAFSVHAPWGVGFGLRSPDEK